MKSEFNVLGEVGIVNRYKAIEERTPEIANEQDDVPELENAEDIEEIEIVESDDFNELKTIIKKYVADTDAFGKQVDKLPGGAVKELNKACPDLNLATIIAASDVGNGYLIFTTAAMYVRTGNLFTGKYTRIKYDLVDYDNIATAAGKEKGTRKIMIPFKNEQGDDKHITIDDSKITEERLQDLLKEIHDSKCEVADMDSNINMPDLDKESQILYFQALGNILCREERSLTELYMIVNDYSIADSWAEIAAAFNDNAGLKDRITRFQARAPYPSESNLSLQAVLLALQSLFRTNKIEGKEVSMLSSDTEDLIQMFDSIGMSEKDFNELIKIAADSMRIPTVQSLYDVQQRLGSDMPYSDNIKAGTEVLSKELEEAIAREKERKDKKLFGVRLFDGFGKKKNEEAIKIPDYFEEQDQKLPEGIGIPKDAAIYGMRTGNTSALLISYPVPEEISMPFDDNQAIIDEMHQHMGANEGLIEVNNGLTEKGRPYVYEILKHQHSEEGDIPMVEYTLNINVKMEKSIQFINGSFSEEGTTGMRESTVAPLIANVNKISLEEVMENWFEDPYDPDYKNGFLMNKSEKAELDEQFPWHALSECRSLVRYIVENN